MRNPRDVTDYITDVLDAIEKIGLFIEGMDVASFATDDKTFFAVVRGLEVIGEAVKQVPTKIRERYPDIPWSEIAGMRDKLIHAYFGVDSAVVWVTATEDVPALKVRMRDVLKDLEKSG